MARLMGGPHASGPDPIENEKPWAPPTVLLVRASRADASVGPSELRRHLDEEGFTLRVADSVDDAVAAGDSIAPALILFDQGPGGSERGNGALQRLRDACRAPIIVLSATRDVGDRVAALEGGADDFLLTPFDSNELAARIRAVLRRGRSRPGPTTLSVGSLEMDLERRMCRVSGTVVPLARSEWRVLAFLAHNVGRVVIATDILRQCWGPGYEDDLQILRICISRLRRKIGGSGRSGVIRTYHNVGYALEP